ncbi:MAG: TlpA family protein disulfide reductase [Saprospiraceae bacterium]|nr:TlpA family protein disulfide reductase [Saprospiraceae bacterium]
MYAAAKKAVVDHDADTKVYIDSMLGVDPFLGKLAAINSYQSFITDPKGYTSELEHYGMEFFAGIDLKDSAYDELTFLFEAYREYATTFAKLGIDRPIVEKFFDHNLQRIDPSRPAYKNALGGLVLGLQSSQHPAFLVYGKRFFEKYKAEGQPHVLALEKSLVNARSLLEGGEAPELSGMDPDGNKHNLSDLRGKYVLVDFWASWCGPCRRENPAVVKLYEQYHDQGFEIFGVSLDRQKERWVKAIDEDGLVWNHISDLKGWQSEHAALYGVRSIPTTILLDKEGKVLKRKLRAHELEQELKKLFSK